jgi:DUF1009 family protein
MFAKECAHRDASILGSCLKSFLDGVGRKPTKIGSVVSIIRILGLDSAWGGICFSGVFVGYLPFMHLIKEIFGRNNVLFEIFGVYHVFVDDVLVPIVTILIEERGCDFVG